MDTRIDRWIEIDGWKDRRIDRKMAGQTDTGDRQDRCLDIDRWIDRRRGR